MTETQTPEKNWAGNYTYQATKLHQPTTIEQLQSLIANTAHVRVLGSRHSFNDIADSAELISLHHLPANVVVDHDAQTVSLGSWMTYGSLIKTLHQEGVALHNLASLPHISVAGAIATATHGSGVTNGNLATAVVQLEMVKSNGELLTISRDDPSFNGLVVGLGALGAVTRITLQVQPAYDVQQRVFENLSWKALYDHFDEITSIAYSVSIFTRWGKANEQVWVKRRMDQPDQVGNDLFGATPATVDLHPLPGLGAAACTPQLGRPGLWFDRLPHFRLDHTPSNGEEIQSEYLIPRRHALSALEAVHALADHIQPLLLVSEIRRVAADQLWMSMCYQEDCVAIHFTWKRQPEAVHQVLLQIEQALAPFEAHPHWGKVFYTDAKTLRPRYQRHTDFLRLLEQFDPRGAFHNHWLQAHILDD